LNISKLTNNTNFTEVREFVGYRPHTDEEKRMSGGGEYKWTNSILIRFVFITRAWNKYVNEERFLIRDSWTARPEVFEESVLKPIQGF